MDVSTRGTGQEYEQLTLLPLPVYYAAQQPEE